MFKSKTITLFVVVLMIQIVYSCSAIDTSESTTNKNNSFWNDAESELAADSLVNTIINSELLKKSKNQKPKVIVGRIINTTREKIDSKLIEKNLERSLLNSGRVTFISSKAKRELVRNERIHSENFANKNEFKKYLKPLKSDYLLDGKLYLRIDSLSSPIVKKYELAIQIIDSKNVKEVATYSWKVIR